MSRILSAAVAAAGDFSGAVRVTVDGAVACEVAHGLADRARGIANTVDTRFGIASGTKLITALGAGVLIDDGRAALATPLVDVVAAPLPNVSPAVTIGHLLAHTSGVYDFYDEELVDDFDSFELAVPPQKLETLDDYLPLLTAGAMKFEPGARLSYSNGGYVLLGLAIETLSGTSYHAFVTERVLRAAGMDDSGFFRFDQLPERVAIGYVGDDTNAGKLPIIGAPDGGMFATVGDIERLWRALVDGRILSPSLTAAFTAPANHYKDDIYYGLGLCVRGSRLYIEGADAGVSFMSTCYAPGTIATVVSNTSEGAWAVADAIDAALKTSR